MQFVLTNQKQGEYVMLNKGKAGAGPPQHGLSSNTMARITSDCCALRLPEHQMAVITAGDEKPRTADYISYESAGGWVRCRSVAAHSCTPYGDRYCGCRLVRRRRAAASTRWLRR